MALHTALFIGLARLLPGGDFVSYPDLGSADTPWIRQFIVPLLAVLALQVVVITRLGWWRPVLRDDRPLRWPWALAFVALVLPVSSFLRDGADSRSAALWAGLTVTMLLVGLTEEITFRGVVLVGARQHVSERVAFLVSSGLFGLFHLPNIILGSPVGSAVVQVIATACIGSAFYVFRRVSRTIWVPVALHATWDWLLISTAL